MYHYYNQLDIKNIINSQNITLPAPERHGTHKWSSQRPNVASSLIRRGRGLGPHGFPEEILDILRPTPIPVYVISRGLPIRDTSKQYTLTKHVKLRDANFLRSRINARCLNHPPPMAAWPVLSILDLESVPSDYFWLELSVVWTVDASR